jgi:multiple sugar transport system substrate-binding protein
MSIGINMSALFFLPAHFRAAGVEPPVRFGSLAQLDAVGEKLNQFDAKGILTRLGWMPSGLPMFAPIFGGGFYDWRHDRVTIDTPENRAALRYIVKERKHIGYDQVVRFNSGLDVNSFAGGWPFIGGAYSVVVDGQWRVEQLRKYAPNLEYRTAPVPPAAGGRSSAGNSNGNFMVVPMGAKEPKGAWEFIKFWSGLTNPAVAAEFYTWGGWLPLTPQVANAPAYQAYLRKYPQFKTFVDLMPSRNIDVLPPVPYQEFLSDEISKAEDAASHGSVDPDQAIINLQSKMDAELNRRRELGE